jgi:hypothetical protein
MIDNYMIGSPIHQWKASCLVSRQLGTRDKDVYGRTAIRRYLGGI